MDLKPEMFSHVVKLTKEQEKQEIAMKESVMQMTIGDVSSKL